MSEGLFRKAAIDKVSSPEQLDLLMRVTSPVGWLALVTVAVMIASVVVWAVVGTISDSVDGEGVMFVGERSRNITAGMNGSIISFSIKPGMSVSVGQAVATIQRDQAAVEQRDADDATIAKNSAMIARKQSELSTLARQYQTQKLLVDQGIKAPKDLLNLDREMNGVRSEIDQLQVEIQQIQARRRSTTSVTATAAGRVTEVLKSVGDKVREDEVLFRVEPQGVALQGQPCGGQMHVILYVPAASQGKVVAGQVARVSPSDVKKEEYGFIFGRVESISRNPASSVDMTGKLNNDQLVRQFQAAGTIHELRVCLDADAANKVNGLRWSSSLGPPKKIEAGTTCTASIVVEEKRPYTYVIPAVKRTVGL